MLVEDLVIFMLVLSWHLLVVVWILVDGLFAHVVETFDGLEFGELVGNVLFEAGLAAGMVALVGEGYQKVRGQGLKTNDADNTFVFVIWYFISGYLCQIWLELFGDLFVLISRRGYILRDLAGSLLFVALDPSLFLFSLSLGSQIRIIFVPI